MMDPEKLKGQPLKKPIEERYRDKPAVRTLIDSMTLINRSYVYEFASEAYCRSHGRSRGEIIGNSVASVWGEEDFNKFVKRYLDQCFIGKVVNYENWLEFADVGLRCYRVSYSPYFNEKGEVTHAVVSSLDITDAKKEEEALEKSEAQFRNILKTMHYGVYTFDAEGRFTYINDVVAKRSGYPREWHLERTLFDLVREQEREMVRKNFEAAVRGEHVQPYEFAYYRPEGDIAWVHISTTAIREGGRITGVLGFLLDVTKRRKSEEALKDSGQKLKSILYGSPIPQFVIDKEHRVTHWNRALEALSGIKAEEMIGTQDHWKAFYGTKRPCIADLMVDQAIGQMADWYDGKFSESHLVDGAYKATDFFDAMGDHGKWLYFTAAVIRDSENNIVGALETLEDITEQKLAEQALRKAEAKYRSIFENAVEGIFQTTPEGQFISVNPAYARIMGYQSPAQMMREVTDIGKQVYVKPEDRLTYKSILAEQGIVQRFETQFQRKDGSICWVSINARAVKDEAGAVLYYEGTVEDFTESKREIEELRRMVEKGGKATSV